MTDAMMPYQGAYAPLLRDSRRAGRQISRQGAHTQLRLAGIDYETDVTIGKEESVTAATGNAMGQVVRIAQLQAHLETIAPTASGRLAVLADNHALSMIEIVADHQRVVRRR
jgi:hypothetical protein